jgi:hypothetical protein
MNPVKRLFPTLRSTVEPRERERNDAYKTVMFRFTSLNQWKEAALTQRSEKEYLSWNAAQEQVVVQVKDL